MGVLGSALKLSDPLVYAIRFRVLNINRLQHSRAPVRWVLLILEAVRPSECGTNSLNLAIGQALLR